MAKIFFCGDPHGKYEHIIRAVETYRPDALVLLGDQTAQRPLDVESAPILDKTQIYWICGNHDTDSAENYDNLFESKLKGRNVQERRVVEVGGILIAGIGGVSREKIWDGNAAPIVDSPQDFMKTIGPGNKWRDGLPLRHRSTVFPSTVRSLADMRVDILVTHEGPDLHHFGKSALTKLAQDLHVKKAFHGHHHQNINYSDGVWHGVSLCAITELDTGIWKTKLINPGVMSKKRDPLAQ